MKISYNWLQAYFEKPIPPVKELAELFTFHSFEIEGLEEIKDGSGKISDTSIDAKILPDRAHFCLSHRGIAEEISVLTCHPLKKEVANGFPEIPADTDTAAKITISAPAFCRRYMGRTVENISIKESPVWLATFLSAIGERTINPIVDATNITMFDGGQPLHAFDADKVKGGLVIRPAKEGEMITLLDGKEVTLTAVDHVIADDEGPLAIAGVKGGKRAEVTKNTTRIYIESANFEPSAVRHTATRLNLRNESSRRFENEITPELAASGMNAVSALLKEMTPDAKWGPIVDVYPVKPVQTIISITPGYISEKLGIEVPEAEIESILSRMNIALSKNTTGEKKVEWKLTIPFKRLDLTIAEDIVEEVGRIYGYEKIKGVLPPAPSKKIAVEPAYYLAEKIKNILVEQGFSEVNLYTLVAKGDIETAYPLAKDKAFARKNLADNLMVALEKNALNADLLALDTIKLFEIGRTFSIDGEKKNLALGIAQVKKVKGLKSETLVSEVLAVLSKNLSLTDSALTSAKIITKGTLSLCEISLDDLLKAYTPADSCADLTFVPASENKYLPFSVFPFIVRDIAVFVPDTISADVVWNEIEKGISDAGAEVLLTRHGLFDSFTKEGKTSFAFRMVFQAHNRTLTDIEVASIMEKINSRMTSVAWQVR